MSAKTVLITGANRGIGLETARQMGLKGYHVLVGSRDAAKGEAAVAELKAKGVAAADPIVIDCESDASVAAAVAAVTALTNGTLDVLINNAGFMPPRGTVEVNLDDALASLKANLLAPIRVTNHFLPLLRAAPAGRIVNLGSIMGSLELQVAGIDAVNYNMAKTALNMYSVNLASALKDTNIKVNVAHPGWVKTDMGGADADLSIEEGAETSVYLATLPDDGPTGGYFFKKDRLPW